MEGTTASLRRASSSSSQATDLSGSLDMDMAAGMDMAISIVEDCLFRGRSCTTVLGSSEVQK